LANYYHPKNETPILSPEERNELEALDIIIGLSREERSYLLSVWRSSPSRLGGKKSVGNSDL
jgi:hypothetical protein